MGQGGAMEHGGWARGGAVVEGGRSLLSKYIFECVVYSTDSSWLYFQQCH